MVPVVTAARWHLSKFSPGCLAIGYMVTEGKGPLIPGNEPIRKSKPAEAPEN